MTFANCLNLSSAIAIIASLFIVGALKAQAQDNSAYTPPVMFYDEIPPMVRPETKTGNIVEPKVSQMPEEDRPVAPRITKPMAKPPLPTKKPAIAQENPIIKQPAIQQKPMAENSDEPLKRERPSAIQGPKTMPALPTANVDKQVLFNGDEEKNAPTIFERNQKKIELPKLDSKKSNTLTPVIAVPKNTSNPATFETGESNALKRTIQYDVGQIALSDDITNSLAAGVVSELDKEGKKNWRVQIKSFATPNGSGISSDKRTALSRALSLRSSLISQGVPPNKIDVLAEGIQTDTTKSGDRIDLYLYKPSSK